MKTKQRIEQAIEALCDELYWGLRSFYAAKTVFETEVRLTPTLFDTFYFTSLDQAALILSRMVIAKDDSEDDESINLQYLANQAKNNPSTFKYVQQDDLKRLLERQAKLLELHRPIIATLKNQRDQNLAHLDRRHINDPNWRKNQTQLDFSQLEKLYQDLIGIITDYYRLFYGGELTFLDWESVTKVEVQDLIEYYESYQSKL